MSASAPFEGVWQMIRAEFEGELAPNELTESTTMELSRGGYVVRFGGSVADQGTVEWMPDLALPTFVLHGTAGPNAGRSIPCIFQLRGDRLRVCFGLNAIAPQDFTTRAADGRYLATYRRA